jgi:hypothetical protein
VNLWIYAPDGTVLKKYWYGTGNKFIGSVYTQRDYDERRDGLRKFLSEAVDAWKRSQDDY